MSNKKRFVLIVAILAIVGVIAYMFFSNSTPAVADEEENTQQQIEESATENAEGEEAVAEAGERFTVEGAPAGISRRQEIITDNETGRQYMIVFEGRHSVAFELNPVPVTAETEAKSEEQPVSPEGAENQETSADTNDASSSDGESISEDTSSYYDYYY